jgi:L-ascorbate metabolism protein UlaG (beta-lactamase superfamily)
MSKTAVTRVTHSCHLIEIGGRTFLTDPWFSTRPGYYQGEPVAREHRRVGLDLPGRRIADSRFRRRSDDRRAAAG